MKKIESHKSKVKTAEDEVALLRERAYELQSQIEKAKADESISQLERVGPPLDTFDTEGQYQVLYKECLVALNKERDLRHEVRGR